MKAAAARPLGQLPAWAKAALAAGAIVLFLIALAMTPIVPTRPYLDFQVLYQTDMGLLRGIPVYDYAGQVQMIAQLAGVQPDQVALLPFPYPPWYALGTIWLAWLPIGMAARVWFGINLLLLFTSIALLTEGWQPIKRVAAFGLAFFFLPVLGSLLVGQYTFPLLLGASLMIHALQRENAPATTVAAILLTLKPHLGALLLLGVLIYLWQQKNAFGRRAMLYMLGSGILLFLAGFLADPAWPLNYVRSLLGFQKAGEVPSCVLCAGLPAIIGNHLDADHGLRVGLVLGAIILVTLAILWARRLRGVLQEPARLVAVISLIVLLVSPYLLNYDFLLLLVPLAMLAGESYGPGGWLLIGLAYGLPFLVMGLLGRQGNFIFPLDAILLAGMLYAQTRPLDGSVAPA